MVDFDVGALDLEEIGDKAVLKVVFPAEFEDVGVVGFLEVGFGLDDFFDVMAANEVFEFIEGAEDSEVTGVLGRMIVYSPDDFIGKVVF